VITILVCRDALWRNPRCKVCEDAWAGKVSLPDFCNFSVIGTMEVFCWIDGPLDESGDCG